MGTTDGVASQGAKAPSLVVPIFVNGLGDPNRVRLCLLGLRPPPISSPKTLLHFEITFLSRTKWF
jgi:hypothetical protein